VRDKRALDLLVGLPLAVAAAPLIGVAAIWILATDGWPALIRQNRVGAHEQNIVVLKLRTMKTGSPIVAKSLLASRNDIYTPGGRFMRRWSVDELPQLFNVLRGDMSIVGPRPALPSQHDLLALRRKHDVTALKPGLTGLAQVKGRESLSLPSKVRLEGLYRQRQSLRLDLVIIVRTVWVLISGRGAS
jgi:O-antigen biosynthesis protein WbqP